MRKTASMLSRGMRRLELLYMSIILGHGSDSTEELSSRFPSSDNVKQLKSATCYVQIDTHSAICLKDEDYDIRSERERRHVGTIRTLLTSCRSGDHSCCVRTAQKFVYSL
jgi:hypothetical protein